MILSGNKITPSATAISQEELKALLEVDFCFPALTLIYHGIPWLAAYSSISLFGEKGASHKKCRYYCQAINQSLSVTVVHITNFKLIPHSNPSETSWL